MRKKVEYSGDATDPLHAPMFEKAEVIAIAKKAHLHYDPDTLAKRRAFTALDDSYTRAYNVRVIE